LDRGTEEAGWSRIETKVRDFTALLGVGSGIYAGTYENGVVRVSDDHVDALTENFSCRRLCAAGQDLIAIGEPRAYIFAGGSWQTMVLPRCAANGVPTE
jgi:hypothetical protein